MILRIVSIIFVGMAVNIYIPVAPSILGALVDYQDLTSDVAGRLISYNFWGATVSTVFAIFILHRPGWNLRLTLFVCLLLIIFTSAGSAWFAGDIGALGVVLFFNGIGAGLGFTTCCVAVIGTPHIERSYALLYGLTYMISGIGLALLPYVYQAVGIEGAFFGMGILNLIAFLFLPFIPKMLPQTGSLETKPKVAIEKSLLLLGGVVIAVLFLHYVFNSGIWTYFERLGVASGMSAERAGALLAPSMTAAIIGMVAASVLGDKIGYLRPIYIGFVAILVSTFSLLYSSSEVVFVGGTTVFNASITFVTPYFVAILAMLVPSGLGVTAANISTIAGFSIGPFLLSFMIVNDDFQPAILLTAAGFFVAFILFVYFVRLLRRSPGGEGQLKAVTTATSPIG